MDNLNICDYSCSQVNSNINLNDVYEKKHQLIIM